MNQKYDCSKLENEALIAGLKGLVSDERKVQAAFLAHLAEVDSRMLYAELGYSSLFAYCLGELGFAEGSTSKRIRTARSARQYPIIYSLIEEGKIHMTAVALLSSLLTQENHQELLNRACGKSKREIEILVAGLESKGDTPDLIRSLPTKKREITIPGDREEASLLEVALNTLPQSPKIEELKPLSEERVQFKFTGSSELRAKIERAKTLLRHKYPEGKLENIIDEAIEALLDKRDSERKIARKKKQTFQKSVSSSTKRIPQQVKDTVWKRDKGQCTYVSATGRQCREKAWLEYDHIQPWAYGGASDDPTNVRLLCRTHNQLSARKVFTPYSTGR